MGRADQHSADTVANVKRLLQRAYWKLVDLEPEPLRTYRTRRRRLAAGERLKPEVLDRLRREFDAHPERAIVVRPQATSPQLFYVFQGRGMGLMMEPMEFLRETGLLHANLVMLRDYHRCFYHRGLNAELPDVDAIRARLAACRAAMSHVRQSFCMGSSAGGYAAILFGHYLGVDAVYAFAPQTRLDLKLLRQLTARDDGALFPSAHRDLALLLAQGNGRTQYDLFYSQGNATDRRFAERLRRCPGVRLHPQPGTDHRVIKGMYESGRLRELLAANGTPAARE